MKNNKKLFIFGFIFVIVTIVLISIFSILSTLENNNLENIAIYYYDKVNNCLAYEEKNITLKKENAVDVLFNEMKTPPKSVNLQSVVPQSINVLSYSLNDTTLTINVSNNYNTLSSIEQLIFRAGIVWTLTELNFITDIKLFVNNEEIKYNNNSMALNRNNIILNPLISPDKIEEENVILYFSNSNNKLSKESRNIKFKQNKSMESHIVEELINGPKINTNIASIPSETKIRNIKTENNICYVDLSSEFINRLSSNKIQENLAIYSIVNSLTNLPNVSKVQFLIDGEKVNLANSDIDISQPIGRYENVIEKSN